jgi:hypothetical protein
MQEHGHADKAAVDAAAARLAEIKEDSEFARDQLVSVSEAPKKTGLSTALVRRMANDNHPLDQVRSEQRHGRLWDVHPGDICYRVDTEEIVP